MQDFVHLHVHSQYSILDGQAAIKKLVDKAIGDGMKGIAITDHGNMMGIKEFYNYVGKVNKGKSDEEKFKPIKWQNEEKGGNIAKEIEQYVR